MFFDLRRFFTSANHQMPHISNTRINNIGLASGQCTPFDPSPDFMYGFKRSDESVEGIIDSDNKLLAELSVTHDQLANLVDRIFEIQDSEFCGCPIIRWEHIHSPICPWGDFCTKNFFDHTPQVMEVWLCNPDHWRKVRNWYNSFKTNGYPIQDLARLVEQDWVMPFSDLHPHLIREHHFFEGSTPYRVDPRKLAKML